MPPGPLFNPFPGLRPFEPGEEHLFFGREKETDDLLRRLGSHRFLSVVGTSGSGKSSLVRSGLIPALHGGFMARAGSSWRVSVMRPGEDPIGRLAEALDRPEVIGIPEGDLASTNRVLVEATLRRSTLGLVDAVRLSRLPATDNVLVVVDQFEELFRFKRSRQIQNSRDEAVAFVKLLLEAIQQESVPIYIVLTMRSDFIGDCMDYPGLPEAVNESQYLVPRMTRDELRSAITGPVAVAGGDIARRLVVRILNDVGDDQDQLPLMQHVLMRTWDHWASHRRGREPIDIADYEAVGTLRNALSIHAEEAYDETGSDASHQLTERIFRALTDTFSDPRGTRRPTAVSDLAAICESSEADVVRIVEIFRRPGRSFLMPPPSVPLTSRVIVDLSHESLMRCWVRLIGWALEEGASAAFYLRLSREASWWEQGQAGLWGDPELELGLRWREQNHPTAAWTRRYDESFERAMRFLDLSEQERARAKAERRAQRIRRLQVAWGTAAGLLVLLLAAAYAYGVARRESNRAEENLRLAKAAVDETLAASERDPAQIGADVPQLEEFRRDLLERAKRFYLEFVTQKPNSEEFLTELALAHMRLGHIYRMLDDRPNAVREYQVAIARFSDLARGHEQRAEYRQALGNAYNWLGETARMSSDGFKSAEEAYGKALGLQEQLVSNDSRIPAYRQELARSHYNRGILYAQGASAGDANFSRSESDFKEAIRLLESIGDREAGASVRQELSRSYNNLASLITDDANRIAEGQQLFERAIAIHEALVRRDQRNRQYKLELATFNDNLAWLAYDQGLADEAADHNARAMRLIEELAQPAPSLGVELADAHNLEGLILQDRHPRAAVDEFRRSLQVFEALSRNAKVVERSDFHLRVGDLLLNLATLSRSRGDASGAGAVLLDSVRFYAALGRSAAAAGKREVASSVLGNLSRLLPRLTEPNRRTISAFVQTLQQDLGGASARQ
jgi:tetratricopeptide (TPR) repeat protein